MMSWLNAWRSASSLEALLEARARAPQALGERAAEHRHGEEREDVDRHGVLRDPRRAAAPAAAPASEAGQLERRPWYCATTRPPYSTVLSDRHRGARPRRRWSVPAAMIGST